MNSIQYFEVSGVLIHDFLNSNNNKNFLIQNFVLKLSHFSFCSMLTICLLLRHFITFCQYSMVNFKLEYYTILSSTIMHYTIVIFVKICPILSTWTHYVITICKDRHGDSMPCRQITLDQQRINIDRLIQCWFYVYSTASAGWVVSLSNGPSRISCLARSVCFRKVDSYQHAIDLYHQRTRSTKAVLCFLMSML